jgi:hypothetical protein
MVDEKERAERQAELNQRLAEKTHAIVNANMGEVGKATVDAGNHALRAIMLINGGAGVALLAFIGSLASKEGVNGIADLAASMQWFAYGVAVTAMGMCGAYLTNFSYVTALQSMICTWEHPYVLDTRSSTRWRRGGRCLHFFTIVLSLCALGLFVYGMLKVQGEVGKLRLKVPAAAATTVEKR